jgi:hypothetical protein
VPFVSPKRGRDRNAWLDAEVKNGKLTIVVGVEVLAFAAQQRFNEQAFQESEGRQTVSLLRVVNADDFANGVCTELLREAENGDNRIHLMLDAAIDEAVNQGSEGLSEDDTPDATECRHEE